MAGKISRSELKKRRGILYYMPKKTITERELKARRAQNKVVCIPLKTKDGKEFGKVSAGGYWAITHDKIDEYIPVSIEERDAIEAFTNYAVSAAQTTSKQKEEDKIKKAITHTESRDIYEMRRESNPDLPEYGSDEHYDYIKWEYDLMRQQDPSLPEFASYDYFVRRAEELAPAVEVKDTDIAWRDSTGTARDSAENYSKNPYYAYDIQIDKLNVSDSEKNKRKAAAHENPELYKEYLTKNAYNMATEETKMAKSNFAQLSQKRRDVSRYINIMDVVDLLSVEGVHLKNGATADSAMADDVDIESGKKEAQNEERLWSVVDNTLSYEAGHLGVYAEANLLEPDRLKDYEKYETTRNYVDSADKKVKAYEYLEEYKDSEYGNNLGGVAGLNYRLGDASEKQNRANYVAYKNMDDVEAGDIYAILQRTLTANNAETYNTEGSWWKGTVADVAQVMPQQINQGVEYAKGYAVGFVFSYGLTFGNAATSKAVGRFAGDAATAVYMFEQTAGASYYRQLKNGLSVEDAHALASTEAGWSAAIEFFLGRAVQGITGKAVGKILSETGEVTAGMLAKKLAKAGISEKGIKTIIKIADGVSGNLGEGAEEWLQEGVSITANRIASEGRKVSPFELAVETLNFSKYSSEDFKQMGDSFKAGFVAGTFQSAVRTGLNAGVSVATDKLTGTDRKAIKTAYNMLKSMDEAALGKEILANKNADSIINKAIVYGRISKNDKTVETARKLYAKIENGETLTNEEVGKLVKQVQLEGNNVFEIQRFSDDSTSEAVKALEEKMISEGVVDKIRSEVVSSVAAIEAYAKATDKSFSSYSKGIDSLSQSTAEVFQKYVQGKNVPDYWSLYAANVKFLSSAVNVIGSDFVHGYIDTFVELLQANNGAVYRALSKEKIDISKALYDYITTGKIPEGITNTKAFLSAAQTMKNILAESISASVTAHKTIYGENATLDAQLEAIKNGDFSFLKRNEYNHLYDETKVSKEFLDSVNEEIENAIIDIRKGDLDSVPDVIEVTELSPETIKKISEFVGFDISGYKCRIEKDALIHIEKRHGINGEHDQSLSDPKDTARMGYAINHIDNIDWVTDEKGNIVRSRKYNNKDNTSCPVMSLSSRIDGTYCVSQAVPDTKRKTIWVTSARIEKADGGSQVPNGRESTPQPTPKAPLVSSSANNNIPQNEQIVNNNGMQNGKNNASEIVTLKQQESIYSVFEDAKLIYEGVDCITDKKVVIPKSDEAIDEISAVSDALIEVTDKYNLARVYDKSNPVIIHGDPKVGDNDTYIFKIDSKFYACRQKHLDAFNNGKRVIKANINEKTGWTVHDENGELVACFMPVKTDSVTEDMYNSLPYVSEVLAKENSTDETSTKELKSQDENDTIGTTVDKEGVVDDGIAERYDTKREENGGVAEEEKLLRRGGKQGNIIDEADSERRARRNSQSDGGENGSDIQRGQELRGVYHGSEYQFETFEKSYVDLGIHFGTKEQAEARLGKKKGNVNRYNLTLKNPLYTEDIFGERDADRYLSDLIEHSKLTDSEKTELKRMYDAYSDDIVESEARQSLKDKLLSEKYRLNAKADKDGIYVTLLLIDESGNSNEIPLADVIDAETLHSLIGEKMASLILEKKSIPSIVKKQLTNEMFERTISFERQFMRLRKIEEILQSFGYDGFVYENQNEGAGISYAVFDNSQITSDNKAQEQEEAVRQEKSRTENKSERVEETSSKSKSKRSLSSKKSKGKLEDFGEKIGGAKKDLWRTRGLNIEDISEMSEYDKQKHIKKDNVWRKPDYDKIIESGVPTEVVYFIKKVRDNLPTTPSYSTSYPPERIAEIRESYINGVREVMDYAMSLKTVEDAKKMLEDFFVGRGYVEKGNYGYLSATEKYRQNNALEQKSNLVNFTAKAARNWEYNILKPMKKDQFGVSKDEKVPKGYEIREMSNGEVAVIKGYKIVQGGFATNADALKWAKENLNATSGGKKRFTPPQLSSIHRQGHDYRENNTKDVEGQNYLDTFKFRGGEFGNWMNESDRQSSMNYGYDALMDLAVALSVSPEDISLGGKLAIAFGARGQAGAVAHFEPGSNVINLTKMKGAGSLAHEWGHAFDFFLANVLESKSTFLTDARGKAAEDSLQGIMNKLVNTMKYREMTADEEAARKAANKESNQKKATSWVDYAFKSITSKFTEEQQNKYNQLKEEYLQGWDQEGPFEIADKFSELHKEVTGRVIPKETRNNITSWYRIIGYRGGQSAVKGRVKTDFYTNSIEMDKKYSKADKGYWQSDVEMFARAFACYVKDKIPGRSDYLVGHAQCNSYMEEDGALKAAFPVGKERETINAVFDELITKAKEEGYLHDAEYSNDTYNTVRYSIESEADYGEGRNLLSNGSGEWQNSKSSGKQTQRVDGRSRRYKEGRKTSSERRKYCQTLKASGAVERRIVYGHQCEVIPEAQYNDRMRKIADQNSQNGIDETIFITGMATLPYVKDSGGKAKTAKGIFIKTKDRQKIVVVQYDHLHWTPEQINDHELVHEDYGSERTQKVKNIIFNTLPQKVKEEILGIISEDYSGVLTNAEEDALEELVANILTEMHYLSDTFSELTKAYWNKDDAFISRWEYETNKQSFKDSVENGFVESMQELNERLDYEESVQLREYIMSVNHSSDMLKEVDCKEIGNNIYVWKNISRTEYDIVRTDSLENGEMAKFIRKEVENGTYRKTEEIRKMLSELNDGYGSDDSSSYDVEDRRANSSNVGVSVEKRASDRYRNSERSSQDSSVEVVKYSLADDGEYDFGDIWDEAVETYGAIPEGEKPAREVSVPKKISDTEPVSYFARTMMEAGVTPDEALSEFEQAILDGTMSHEVITDKRALKYAQETIKHEGFDQAMEDWSRDSARGKVGKKDLAVGMELYNQCVNNKDYKNAMRIAAELAAEATRAGQTLQACRLLKQMSPDGQLYYLEKSVAKMNEEFKQQLGKKFEDIELDEELMEEFYTAENEEQRNEVYDKICQNIADQMPATLLDKWNSWRYLAMLGNPRTHIRNIIGNAVFTPAIRIKNYIGAVLERHLKVDTSERTKSFTKSKKAVEFAKEDFNEMVKVLQGVNAKYAVTSDIDSKRQIFKTKALEKLRTKNFEFLEMEDMWFLKTHYVDALARIITARNIDVDNIDADSLGKARAYAVKEAQAATYRDANVLAEGLNKLQRKAERSGNKAIRATGYLVEGVMPFKKTPLNIAKQGVQYSPVSLLTGIYQLTKGVKEETHTVADAIDTLSKGITGTGLMLLGYFLAQMGILVGEEEEPDKKKEFDEMNGEQSYALKIGDFSYTIDWAAPMCLPLFVGVALHETTKDGSEVSFTKIVDSLIALPEPLLELSVFSGLSDILSAAKYSEGNEFVSISIDIVTNYLTQAFPSIGGQLSRMADSTKRDYYYYDRYKDVPRFLQTLIGKALSKIPLASHLFEPEIDAWGREETYGGAFERAVENFVSPGYYSEERYTEVDKELQDLYERTGKTEVFPVEQKNYYEKDGITYYMTAEQYTEAKKLRGQKSFELVEKLTKSNKYKNMSDNEKVKAIQKCYDEAGEITKESMFDKVKGNTEK